MVGLPLWNLVRVAIAIGGRHGGHVHNMGGLDVAQVRVVVLSSRGDYGYDGGQMAG